MEIISSIKPLLAVIVSLIAAFLILLTGERARNLREFWTILASVIKFTIVFSMVSPIREGKVIEYTVISISPGLSLQFRADALGILFALTASFLWIITSFYSIGYMRSLNERAQTRYFACFAIALSATMGVAFSANLFTTFLFYEIITLSTYPLVAHKETPEAIRGARIYLTYLLGTSIAFLLLAIFMTYTVAGTLDFSDNGILIDTTAMGVSDTFLTITFILFMAGIAKAAMMPLHSWLPAAMVAPTPVSALLHAVVVVKAGVFVVVKVVIHIFGIDLLTKLGLGTALAYFSSFTIIIASIIALKQDNLKRMLAFSTISQLSYIILGAALLKPSSMVGGIIHITNHAFSKITLFFCAGSIYVSAHKTEISQLSGIGKKMPWTMAAFFIGSLSMIGVPPTAGFISKWYLAVGSMEAKEIPILVVLLFSSVLNAAYFLPITYKAFFEKENHTDHYEEVKEIPVVVIPLVITAIISILVGIYPDYFLTLAKEVIR